MVFGYYSIMLAYKRFPQLIDGMPLKCVCDQFTTHTGNTHHYSYCVLRELINHSTQTKHWYITITIKTFTLNIYSKVS